MKEDLILHTFCDCVIEWNDKAKRATDGILIGYRDKGEDGSGMWERGIPLEFVEYFQNRLIKRMGDHDA